MKVTLLLADSAQEVGGKLYILGGGWSNIAPGAPFAIAGKIEVPWNLGAEEHEFRLELLDIDGHPVMVEVVQEDAEGEPRSEPIALGGKFATGIPAGIKPGTPLDGAFAINLGPGMPLEPGKRYEWRLSIDGQTEDDWCLAFNVRPMPARPLSLRSGQAEGPASPWRVAVPRLHDKAPILGSGNGAVTRCGYRLGTGGPLRGPERVATRGVGSGSTVRQSETA